MASTSAPRNNASYGRISSAATTLYSENQNLITEIRRAMNMMKEIAVDLEGDHESDMVKDLEKGVIELLKAEDDCTNLSNAIQSVGNEYEPEEELTNFSKLFDDKIKDLKAASTSNPENHPLLRKFREAIWHVHHPGQLMPGEEQEDIVMTSTECSLLNIKCPLTGKPITELDDPVRSMDCKHIYEKGPIMHHIRKYKASPALCPVTGCPKNLRENRVVCDPLLKIEIDELRSRDQQNTRADGIEDFTGLDED